MKKHPLYTWGKYVGGPKARWITLFVWVLLTLVLSFTWPAVNTVEDETAPNLPETAMSQQANNIIKKEFPNDSGNPVLIVWHKDEGLEEKDFKKIQDTYQKLRNSPLKGQSTLPPFDTIPHQALAKNVSEDGTSLVTPVFFDKTVGTDMLQENMAELQIVIKNTVEDDPFKRKISDSGLHVRLSGPVGIQTDAVSIFSQADVKLLVATVLLVLALLILLYRSPLLAILPLIVVGFAYGIISPTLGFLADKG